MCDAARLARTSGWEISVDGLLPQGGREGRRKGGIRRGAFFLPFVLPLPFSSCCTGADPGPPPHLRLLHHCQCMQQLRANRDHPLRRQRVQVSAQQGIQTCAQNIAQPVAQAGSKQATSKQPTGWQQARG
eukprot:357630-Chlamydomonas_euryale.AAC.2